MPPSVDEIKALVAQDYDLRVVDLTGERRGGGICEARHVAMFLVKTHTGCSYPMIARLFGKRDPSTVWNGVHRIEKRQGAEPKLAARIARLAALLGDDRETAEAMTRAGAAVALEAVREALAVQLATIAAALARDPNAAITLMASAVEGLSHG